MNVSCRLFKHLSAAMSRTFTHCNSAIHNECIDTIKKFIPPLTSDLHKGQCGRIGVIGGSADYTGAPYFASISALKTGADLVYVFCCREAAPIIKSYSPELIVSPILDSDDVVNKIDPWLARLHALVIGPGLGRESGLLKNVKEVIKHCKYCNPLPLIIDADGLYLITENTYLIQDYNGPVILLPNPVELTRLKNKFFGMEPSKIASELNVVLVQKGLNDVIVNGIHNKIINTNLDDVTLECSIAGSNRRCGGQGDILAGCTAAFVAWFHMHIIKKKSNLSFKDVDIKNNYSDPLIMFNERFMGYSFAAYGACTITRHCSKLAFDEKGRSMTASDMIPFLHKAFTFYFDSENNFT